MLLEVSSADKEIRTKSALLGFNEINMNLELVFGNLSALQFFEFNGLKVNKIIIESI